jgi:hypothetical protein
MKTEHEKSIFHCKFRYLLYMTINDERDLYEKWTWKTYISLQIQESSLYDDQILKRRLWKPNMKNIPFTSNSDIFFIRRSKMKEMHMRTEHETEIFHWKFTYFLYMTIKSERDFTKVKHEKPFIHCKFRYFLYITIKSERDIYDNEHEKPIFHCKFRYFLYMMIKYERDVSESWTWKSSFSL